MMRIDQGAEPTVPDAARGDARSPWFEAAAKSATLLAAGLDVACREHRVARSARVDRRRF